MGAELQRLYADGKFAELLAQVDALSGMHLATPSLKKKSDVVHDLLAHLAERMLEMNKQKRMNRSTENRQESRPARR